MNPQPITPEPEEVDNDWHDDPYYEECQEKCPECEGNIVMHYEGNGADDYTKIWECKGCGETWSN